MHSRRSSSHENKRGSVYNKELAKEREIIKLAFNVHYGISNDLTSHGYPSHNKFTRYTINNQPVAVLNHLESNFPQRLKVVPETDLDDALHSYDSTPNLNPGYSEEETPDGAYFREHVHDPHISLPHSNPIIIHHSNFIDPNNPRGSILHEVAKRIEPHVYQQGFAQTDNEGNVIGHGHPVEDYLDELPQVIHENNAEKYFPYLHHTKLEGDENKTGNQVHRYLRAMLTEAHEKYNDFLDNIRNNIYPRVFNNLLEAYHQDFNSSDESAREHVTRLIRNNPKDFLKYIHFNDFVKKNLWNNLPEELKPLKDQLVEGLDQIRSY